MTALAGALLAIFGAALWLYAVVAAGDQLSVAPACVMAAVGGTLLGLGVARVVTA